MKLGVSLLYLVLVSLTTAFHAYYVWKRSLCKLLYIQVGIAVLAAVVGIAAIYCPSYFSISKVINLISPLGL